MKLHQVVIVTLLVIGLCDAWRNLKQRQSPRSMQPKTGPLSSASRGSVPVPPGLWNPSQMSFQNPGPLRSDTKKLPQDPFGVQSQQVMQAVVEPLDWRYPVVPEIQANVAVDFQQKQPVTPSSVAIQCGESSILVEVKQDLFSNGQLIDPSGLHLGGCSPVAQDFDSKILIFEYALQDCGSVLMMTNDELVYMFVLTYTPQPLGGTMINRADGATVNIQCHYQRNYNVSSNVLNPAWVPYSSTEVGEEVLLFSLKLMTDDWMYQRPSAQYYLGDIINIEGSVKVYNHVPLRVFVDGCVATQVPDPRVPPQYSFIENNGCFVDAKNTGSSSHFLPRTRTDAIQFQLEAFLFKQQTNPSIYITCLLRATTAVASTDAQHKSCSFIGNRWFAADGNDQVCGCCDSTCGPETTSADVQWEGKASVGPLTVKAQ
ncbi:zona pellucida sperm-binding protein 3-like [Paramisgurnus dabryanus]|uniref:zona pellucida sperm-binding protein 3-like n=1 Tax=Paramisgurnus dabryanus TaxID=90735 RepID=UPI0031F3719D